MSAPAITRPVPPVSDSTLLALIHTEAASVANVRAVKWVGHGIWIVVPDVPQQETVTDHLFGTTHPVGHWRLHHVGVSDHDARRVTVTVAVGGVA